jgi:RNA polymerase sigma factor (sigma-70 family)
MPQHSPSRLLGDEADLYAEHAAHLARTVHAAVNTTDAIVEDACSTAWAVLLRRQPSRGATLFAWLRIVAIREAIRLDRAARASASFASESRLDPDYVSPEHARRGLHIAVHDEPAVYAREALREIAQLPERPRRVFAMHIAGYDYAEISELTGDTVRTVDRLMRRARQQIRWPQA